MNTDFHGCLTRALKFIRVHPWLDPEGPFGRPSERQLTSGCRVLRLRVESVLTLRLPMKMRLLVSCLAVSFTLLTRAGAAPSPAEQAEFFEQKIRPVLVAECYECHAGKKRKGGLLLDSREGWRAGGDSGAAIVPGRPEESLLIRSITHADADLKMPSKAPKLEDRVIADFVAWVKMGAPDPREQPDKAAVSTDAAWADTLAARRKWWCFQPIKTAPVPVPQTAAWSDHPIDRFLLAKMEARGLTPAAPADPRTLVRRLTFALTGLPPRHDEVEAFIAGSIGNRQS